MSHLSAAGGAVRLRGHHLLCLLTYVGKGYSPAFVAGMDAVVARLQAGAEVLLVEGPDDICAAHVADCAEPHCLRPRAAGRDAAALLSVGALIGRVLVPGDTLDYSPAEIDRLRQAFRSGAIRAACAGCEWGDLCTAIAAEGFAGVRLANPVAGSKGET